LNLGPLDGDEWGFTGTFAKENGGGFLTDHYPRVRMFDDCLKACLL
jgi:formamidase